MRTKEEIRKKLRVVTKNIMKYHAKRYNSNDPNAKGWELDLEFYNAGEYWLQWVLNEEE